MSWSLFVKGDKTYSFKLDKRPDVVLTLEIKQMLATKTGLEVEDQRFIYAGKELKDNVALGEYMIHDNATINLVQRLLGGSSPFKTETRPLPTHLPTTGDGCCLCNSLALQMPCGHPYCSNCVAVHAWNEASQTAKLRSEVRCCLCDREWSFKVLKEYGAMMQEEVQLLADCLSHNYLRDREKVTQCPYCDCYCERKSSDNPRVRCHFCKSKGEFCWHCKKPWKSDGSATKCGNCKDVEVLNEIKVAKNKKINGINCPSVRLCPGCGVMTEHKEKCKRMKCKICGLEFCFICLRGKENGSWSCDSVCVPAPTQTVVPTN